MYENVEETLAFSASYDLAGKWAINTDGFQSDVFAELIAEGEAGSVMWV